ncbi:MAG: hypothetical protein LLF28_08490 [Nitrospiraceae bacterium]|nr:hypothetical protein [Nitrospiraceae bacterium]
MKIKGKLLGELLIENNVIDQFQLSAALGHQKQWGGKLGSSLIEMGFVEEKKLASFLEQQLGERCIYLDEVDISPQALKTVKFEIAKKHCIMPVSFENNTLVIATGDPTDIKMQDELSFKLNCRIKPILAIESDIKNAISKHYEGITINSPLSFRSSAEKLPETMDIIRSKNSEAQTEGITKKEETDESGLLNAIVSLLLEKGIITNEELFKKVNAKTKKFNF